MTSALRSLLGGALALLVALLVLGLAADLLGDPVSRQIGPEGDAAASAALRAALGLDAPWLERVLRPMLDLFRGDLGTSSWLRRPAGEAVAEALGVTLRLALLAWPVGLAAGAALGLALAALPARLARLPLLLLAVPGFVVAVVAVEVFAVGLGWVPAAGYAGLRSLLLPAALLAGALAVKLALILQDGLRAIATEPFAIFAEARGLSATRRLLAYRLLPASALLARFGALQAGYLLGGALVMETVFALPGLGRLAVLALQHGDLPLLRAAMLAAGTGFLVARFVAEAAQAALDPRPTAARIA
ncbi:ABC transporter permease subunit [Falsiroseomonas tokyonensis]|uniref:ABC transporter permease subunit n=1 Tax=Falsiroseomonas tokyonensis TaxID=430521 RepID=A0ABV7BQB4_9PROT|nr:ABC transporter permease subunit [Falsiroseomonas tokyonensis]